MALSPNHPPDFTTPSGGGIRGTSAIFRVSFGKRQHAKVDETVADNDGEEDMFSAAGIAAEEGSSGSGIRVE